MRLITAYNPPESPTRTRPADRAPLRVAAVQQRWHRDPAEHLAALREGIRLAAAEGARVVCLQELTLSPYFAVAQGRPPGTGRARGPADRPDLRLRGRGRPGVRRVRARLPVRAGPRA